MTTLRQPDKWRRRAYEQIRNDPVLGAILNNHPSNIENYIEQNVKDMAAVKLILKKLIYAVRYLLKHQVRLD